nr:chromate efflux transporter [Nakamurella flava]
MTTRRRGDGSADQAPTGSAAEVFRVFLRLGLTSFGGPVAHLGYYRADLVERRRWLTDAAYADVVALCQFLPGPTSSQVGMVLGLQRAGYRGMLAAWVAFTMPSALLMIGLAYGIDAVPTTGAGWLRGLLAAAVAVVALAVLSMAQTLTPDARRATIAVGAMIAVLVLPGPWTALLVLLGAGLVGAVWLAGATAGTGAADASVPARSPVSRTAAASCLVLATVLFVALPALATATGNGALRLAEVCYRAGAAVFGGGHVVLPLLESSAVPAGLIDQDVFLAGYGAVQAAPGPLFSVAAFLGAANEQSPSGVVGGLVALVAIFLPGALLVVGVLPSWAWLQRTGGDGARRTRRVVAGVNAGVVGVLAAALYTPVFTSGVTSVGSLAVAAAAFVALKMWRVPPWAVVVAAAVVGALLL